MGAPRAGHIEAARLDGGRAVSVYVPPSAPTAVVYAADGQRVARWGGALEASDLAPILVVGVHGRSDETERLHEYSPGFDAERFEAHERLFVDDVRRWATSRFDLALPAERTAVYGASAGGELALALGLRHPEVYGAILAASPGAGYRPPEPLPERIPRTYLVAGTGEPFFLENAVRWADALRLAGAEVVLAERDGEHGGALWRRELPAMLRRAFDDRRPDE